MKSSEVQSLECNSMLEGVGLSSAPRALSFGSEQLAPRGAAMALALDTPGEGRGLELRR